jgi:hypothetical protein
LKLEAPSSPTRSPEIFFPNGQHDNEQPSPNAPSTRSCRGSVHGRQLLSTGSSKKKLESLDGGPLENIPAILARDN